MPYAPEALRSVLHFAKPSDVRSPWKGLGRQSLRGDVTEARRDFVTSVQYKNSSGFSLTNFSVKHRPFLYLLTFVLAIKPLLFLYIVRHWHFFLGKQNLF